MCFANYMRIRIFYYNSFPQREFLMSGISCLERERASSSYALIPLSRRSTPLIEANNNNLHLLRTHCQETQKHIINVMCCDRPCYPVRDIATNHPIINLQIPENRRVLDENQCDCAGNQSHQINLISSNVRVTGLEDKATAIDVKYSDFSKPFSSVPYDGLINML